MTEQRGASKLAELKVRAVINEVCHQGAGLSYSDEIAEPRDALLDYIACLEADRRMLATVAKYYVAADFAYPQYEGYSCLIIALPKGVRVGSDVRQTLATVPDVPRPKSAWKPAPRQGYVTCQRCFAVVEDKGLKRATHLTSAECQACSPYVGGAPTQEGE